MSKVNLYSAFSQQTSRIEFLYFSFRVGLFFNPDTKNNANFDAVSSKHANYDEVHFFLKHAPKLTVFGTLQTFEYYSLVNEFLLMQFYLFHYIHPKLHHITGSDENYASHCSELSQLHQQPVDAVLHPTFIWKLCYNLPSVVIFSPIQTSESSGQYVVFFTEQCHVDRQCDA